MEDQVIKALYMMHYGEDRLSIEHLINVAIQEDETNFENGINNVGLEQSRLECFHCKSNITPEWRRGPDGDRTLCNACGLFYSKLIKRYGEEKAKDVMMNRRFNGNSMDRRISI